MPGPPRRRSDPEPTLSIYPHQVHIGDRFTEADIGDERYDAAEAPGLDAVIRGLALQARDDLHLIELTGPLYDALYALWSGEP